jgi:tetratricopeptide (TPR) repeat protein
MTTVSIFAKKPEASPELMVATARVYERTGNYEAAAGEYEKALKKTPNDVATILSYAHLLDHEGKLADATQMYQRAIKTNPHEPAAYNDLGLCLARRGMMKDSSQALAKAVEMQPERELYRNNYASVLVEMKRVDEALVQLKAAHPEAVAQYNLAVMLQQHNQDALAYDHFRRALELDPGFAQAREWTQRLTARNSTGIQLAQAPTYASPATNAQMAAYQAVSPPPVRVASVPAPVASPGSYGVAPQPEAVSSYLRPELSPRIEAGQLAAHYGAVGTSDQPNSTGSPVTGNVQSSEPAMPPMPDSFRNYPAASGADFQYLPPVQ